MKCLCCNPIWQVYFNWLVARYPDEVRLRSLVSLNSGRRRELAKFRREAKYDWVAFHSYLVVQDLAKNPHGTEEGCAAETEEHQPATPIPQSVAEENIFTRAEEDDNEVHDDGGVEFI